MSCESSSPKVGSKEENARKSQDRTIRRAGPPMSRPALARRLDIYVAFAFAAADVLLEIDGDGRVVFAVGAARALLGWPARVLAGMRLDDLIAPADHGRAATALMNMMRGERVRNSSVSLRKQDGSISPGLLSGYRSPDNAGHLLVVLGHSSCSCAPLERRLAQSGLLDQDSFQARTRHLLDQDSSDAPYVLTMIDLPEIPQLRQQAGTEQTESMVAAIGAYLRDNSIGGDTAGQFNDTTYGLVHDSNLVREDISAAISDIARQTVPAAAPIMAKTHSITLDVADASPEEAAAALTHAVNGFIADGGNGDGTLAALSAGLQPRMSDAMIRMRALRRLIERGDFHMVFQPIVDLWTNTVQHMECLVRLGDDESTPFDTVTFAENVGMAGQFDLAVCERMFAMMRRGPASDPAMKFAINLSGRTLTSPDSTSRLRRLLASAGDLRGRVSFEITESAAMGELAAVNALLQEVRSMGFPVCLDDFGAGAAAFHYLRELKVDHVKIDGLYIKNALRSGESVSFIKAIVGLCAELGIGTTAECVEDPETANLLKLLKVKRGQGWYYGKPFRPAQISGSDTRTPWITPQTSWRNGLLCFTPPDGNLGRVGTPAQR